jgi:hypothetical protein
MWIGGTKIAAKAITPLHMPAKPSTVSATASNDMKASE